MKILPRTWRRARGTPPSPRHRRFRGESRFGTRLGSTSHDAVESFKIACGSAGHITVDIHNAPALSSSNTPLIIYLPSLGAHIRSTHPPIPSFLLSTPEKLLPLVQINYRWNHVPPTSTLTPGSSAALLSSSPNYINHPFPTPLHDTLHAWSWLIEDYLPSLNHSNQSQPQNKSNRSSKPYITPPPSPKSYTHKTRPIIIYGSHLGGTLATTLGLTESHISRSSPFKIIGLIVHNGIFDWTTVATSRDPSLSSSTPDPNAHVETLLPPPPSPERTPPPTLPSWTTQTLHNLKSQLFKDPASTLDPFASPTLFFRSSGLSTSSPIPRYFPGQTPPPPPQSQSQSHSAAKITEDSVAGLNISDTERADLLSMLGVEDSPPPPPSSTADKSPEKKAEEEEEEEQFQPARKSPLKFPPAGSGLRIPRSLFLYSTSASTSTRPRLKPNRNTNPPIKPTKKQQQKEKHAATQTETEGETEMEIQAQTEEIARLMRRSIVMHEFKDRVVWESDGDGDAHAVSEERVRVCRVGVEGDEVGEMEVGEMVWEWIGEGL